MLLLPENIIHKIMLYNSHPCSRIIKDNSIKKFAIFLIDEAEQNIYYKMPFKFKTEDIITFDNCLMKYSWFIYYFRIKDDEILIFDLEDY